MKLKVNKIASSTKNIGLGNEVEVSREIKAREGEVIVVKALEEKRIYNKIELVSGRMAKIAKGDLIVGVLGERKALKGFVGKIPKKIFPKDKLNILNLGGVIGIAVSKNPELGDALRVEAIGSILVNGKKTNIRHDALEWKNSLKKSAPMVFVSGTCMSAGKTTVVCELIQKLNEKGYNIVGAKLTGVAALRDTLNMIDHGAINALSFLDAGLPSTTNLKEVIPASNAVFF